MHNSFTNAGTFPRISPAQTTGGDHQLRHEPTDHESLAKYGVKAFVLPDSGHFPMFEDPPRFNRSLDSVIKGFAK